MTLASVAATTWVRAALFDLVTATILFGVVCCSCYLAVSGPGPGCYQYTPLCGCFLLPCFAWLVTVTLSLGATASTASGHVSGLSSPNSSSWLLFWLPHCLVYLGLPVLPSLGVITALATFLIRCLWILCLGCHRNTLPLGLLPLLSNGEVAMAALSSPRVPSPLSPGQQLKKAQMNEAGQ